MLRRMFLLGGEGEGIFRFIREDTRWELGVFLLDGWCICEAAFLSERISFMVGATGDNHGKFFPHFNFPLSKAYDVAYCAYKQATTTPAVG